MSINVSIKKKKNDNFESMLSRFNVAVKRQGVLKVFRDKMYYEKPGVKKRKRKQRDIVNTMIRNRRINTGIEKALNNLEKEKRGY